MILAAWRLGADLKCPVGLSRACDPSRHVLTVYFKEPWAGEPDHIYDGWVFWCPFHGSLKLEDLEW